MSKPELIFPKSSVVQLSGDSDLSRVPLHANRVRSGHFMERFESQILYYDCFWSHKENSVYLIGPPPLNLDPQLHATRFCDGQQNIEYDAEHHISRSTLITKLENVRASATHIRLEIGGQFFTIEIQPNLSGKLADAKILFSMNKDNDLQWVMDWAEWHCKTHSSDCVVLFDNGSTKYNPQKLGQALAQVAGLKTVVIFDWPHAFGARDDRVWSYHYWAHFLQISSMNLVLKRCAAQAKGLANFDIDELATPVPNSDIFELARAQKYGIAPMAGTWISAVSTSSSQQLRHRDFSHVARGPLAKMCPKKWVLDPQASWVDKLDVFPYWHRIMGAPERKVTDKTIGGFYHFKGISTNWKKNRTTIKPPTKMVHRLDQNLLDHHHHIWGVK